MRFWFPVLLLLSANASAAGVAKVNDPRFTEQRNAATSLVGSVNFYVSRMAARCGAMMGYDPGEFGVRMASRWQETNAPYFNAAIQYQSDLIEKVESGGDTAAFEALTQSIRVAVQDTAQSMVDEQLSGSGDQRLAACNEFVKNMNSGELDIRPSTQYYAVLQALVSEQGKAKANPAPMASPSSVPKPTPKK